MSDTTETRNVSSDGKGCLPLVLVLIGAAGVAFTWFALEDVADTLRARHWPEVPAVMQVSEGQVDRNASEFDKPFTYRSRYVYRYQATPHVSEQSFKTGDWSDVAEQISKYPPGAHVTAHVNPGNPERNHLELPSLWILVLPGIPLALLAAGLIGLCLVWFRKRRGDGRAEGRKSKGLGLMLMFGIFALAGGGICWLLWEASVRGVTAGRWPETTATIEFSRVGAHHSSKGGPTYSIDVLFSYQVNGVTYRSSRYDLEGGSSSGAQDKQAVVERLPPGARVACYYDPANPGYASLDRGFPSIMFLGLIPLFFFVTGVVGLAVCVAGFFRPAPQPVRAGSPTRLRPASSRLAVFAFCVGIAIFWNALIVMPLDHVIRSWRHGNLDLGLTAFLVPFVLVGSGLVVLTLYQFLGFLTPRPQVSVSSTLRLGESATLEWRFRGATSMLRRLQVTLQGQEKVQYRGQKGSSFDSHVFRTVELLDLPSPGDRGMLSIWVPADTMHSFAGEHNEIQWSVRVRGEIPIWPDVDEAFVIEILPLGDAR